MKEQIIDWFRDFTFTSSSTRNAVRLANAFWWRAPSHPAIDLKPEIEYWLEDNVTGKYRILFTTKMLSPNRDPLDEYCTVYFSRVEDAIQFKLAFA
jgi:hypothetical protein